MYTLPDIEDVVSRVQRAAQPPQSRLFGFWQGVFGEPRLPNPCLPQLLDVLWSMTIYPDVKMLEVPVWPRGPPERARNAVSRRLHVVPGSAADLLADWGDGVLGPADRGPLKLRVVHWMAGG